MSKNRLERRSVTRSNGQALTDEVTNLYKHQQTLSHRSQVNIEHVYFSVMLGWVLNKPRFLNPTQLVWGFIGFSGRALLAAVRKKY